MAEAKNKLAAPIVLFLEKRDTVFLEAFLGLMAFVCAWQVTTVSSAGTIVAPFLNTAIKALYFPKLFWVCVLLTMGAVKLLALSHGVIHNNFYRVRAYTAFGASVIWSLLAAAVLTGDQPYPVAAMYILYWAGSISCYNTLLVKQRRRERIEAEAAHLLKQQPAIPCRNGVEGLNVRG
jgi:hypothetical protein